MWGGVLFANSIRGEGGFLPPQGLYCMMPCTEVDNKSPFEGVTNVSSEIANFPPNLLSLVVFCPALLLCLTISLLAVLISSCWTFPPYSNGLVFTLHFFSRFHICCCCLHLNVGHWRIASFHIPLHSWTSLALCCILTELWFSYNPCWRFFDVSTQRRLRYTQMWLFIASLRHISIIGLSDLPMLHVFIFAAHTLPYRGVA